MSIRFTKMHALGNDFMVIDAVHQSISLTPKDIKTLADRHTGIGFDQCLIVEPSNDPYCDFFYRIYNADGSEVGQCGNGARCLARFIQRFQLTTQKTFTVATNTTRMTLHLNDDDTVTVNLGHPHWNASQDNVPELKHIELNHESYHFHEIDVGNPHAVLLCQDIQQAPVQTIGKTLSTHPYFPNQCNIEFIHIINPTHIQCRVYERGCGETQACGSGAVAAAVIGKLVHGLSNPITVTLPGGDLVVEFPEQNGDVFLTGSATFVYDGVLL